MAPYELSVDGVRALTVHKIHGTEQLNEAWRFDVNVTAAGDGPDIEQAALGSRATLTLNTAEQPRAFYGIVSAVRLEEVLADGAVRYTLKVVPRFWLLKKKKRSRIFQRMRVVDIVATVLGEAGIGVQWQLVRPYPLREYCTQYEETDEQFVRRLLAESGIFFRFFTGGPSDTASTAGAVATVAGAAAGVASAIGVPGADALSAAASLAAGLVAVPGDTLVCADDSVCYPALGYDDPAALAAATAASLALGAAEVAGLPGAGVASAVAGAAATAIIGALEGSAPTLQYAPYEAGHAVHREKVARFVLRNSVRSSGAMFRDYDPEKPLVRLQSVAVSTAPFPPSPAEAAAIAAATATNALSAVSSSPLASALPGEAGAIAGTVAAVAGVVADVANTVLGAAVPNEVYEHHGDYHFPRWDHAPNEAPLILRQKRRRASLATGECGNALMAPGHRFSLAGHPAAQLDSTYVLLRVEHTGALRGDGDSYVNKFECAPASMPYPPARPKRKSVQVSLTATVVGPGGEEIYVDGLGRIKVQFHWDREGKLDGNSSCWIRVMQPWGGAGWGVQFIPRVGMEVVVGFEGGDPDKPMILGTLYNGTHPTPFPLPLDRTRSGWRTQTSPGGGGFNELSFEDRKGGEQVFLHAQRDLDEVVLNDHHTTISRDQSAQIGGNRSDDVAGNAQYRTAKDRSEQVGQNYSLAVGKSRKLSVFGSDQERVAGDRTTQIDKAHGVQVGGHYSLMVGTKEQPATAESFIWGDYNLGADGPMILTSDDGITLRCGDSILQITKDGISIKGGKVAVEAAKSATMKGNGPSISLGEEGTISANTINLVSKKASLVLNEDAKLDGTAIKLNCGGIDPKDLVSEDGEPQTKKVSLKLADADGKPHASKEYVLSAGGARFEGTTDGDGKLEVEVPKSATVAQIVLYLGKRPEGEQLRYRVALEELPEDSVKGSLSRLKNLGFYWGEPSDVLDGPAQDSIRAFQRANSLEPTGELDADTKSKLTDAHGH
ncbi:MAG: type VI secretion system tip protein TssI/VgrG [Polyangiaceae bacterium]